MSAASTRADASLECAVRSLRRQRRVRLPTIVTLARKAGVAPATMAKAVTRFRDAGVLSVSHGRGIRIADPTGELHPPAPPPGPLHGRKWQRLAHRVRSDILRGELGPGALLPSRKELGVKHGACVTTVRRALNQLAAEGFLAEDPQGFRVAGSRAQRRTADTVVLVARGDSFGEPSLLSPRTRDHLRFLESVCNRAGLRLDIVTCYYVNTDLQGLDTLQAMLRDSRTRDSLLGFIVWSMGINTGFVGRVLSLMDASGKPVACLDELGTIAQSLPAAPRRLRVFSMASSSRAGEVAGRYLLSRGHRHLAYIAGSFANGFAVQRLRGIRDEYHRAGVAYSIETVEAGQAEGDYTLSEVFEDEQALLRMLVPGYVQRTQGRYSVREKQAVRLAEEVSRARATHQYYERLFATLGRLYENGGATVWVGASDSEALCALDLLRLRGTDAPAKVSVMGFDDGYEGFAQQLTSYNFGGQAYMNAMLNYVLGAAGPSRGSTDTSPVELDGYVSERRTVGAGPYIMH